MEIVCRSKVERFFLEWVSPCPRCGDPLDGPAELYSLKRSSEEIEDGLERHTRAGFCPNCAEAINRVYVYPKAFDPPKDELGGPSPSLAISANQFRAIAAAALEAPEEAAALSLDDFFLWRARIRRGLFSLNELAKFGEDVSEDKRQIERLRDIYADQALLEERNRALKERQRAAWQFNKEAVAAHGLWIESGGASGKRIDYDGVVIKTASIPSPFNLSKVRLHRCWIIGQSLDYAKLVEAELIDCRGFYSRFGLGELNRASFIDCRFTGADFSVSHLRQVTIRGGEFRRSGFVRGDLVEAQVSGVDMRGARFGDTILDDAVFEDCDLRDANFGTAKELFAHRGTTTNTVFRRCDLRGARFAGRNVSGAVFVDCKLHGVTGPARRMAALEVRGADFSPAGDGSVIGTAADIERLLGQG